MQQLTTTSDLIRIVTASAGSVHVLTNWADTNGSTFPVGRQPTNITTAATTTIVPSPGAGFSRRVKSINVENNSGSVPNVVTLQFFDGTTASDLFSVTLLPGENLVYTSEGEWAHHDSNGGDYSASAPPTGNLGATGTIAETHPRELLAEVNTSALTSGTLRMQAIYLVAGQTVSNISVWSATTALATGTNQFFALYDSSRNLLAQSANNTSGAWAANSVKTLAMTTPYKVPVSGLYYIGVMVAATTVPTLKGHTARTANQLAGAAPILAGNSSTGLTTSLPNPAAAITVDNNSFYAAVS